MLPPYPRRFGPYVLVAPIGLGEMGTVSLALMGTRGREKLCVIKMVRPEVLAEPTARARVQRETAIARRLTHGGIAQTFADGEEDGAPYLVQEFVHGWTLSRLLTSCSELQRWPSIPVACHIAQEVARALAYVHTVDDVGVIHRDIAPDNIMIAYSGEVKVIDFGIAKAVGDKSSPGTVVGRYTYGAPEIWDRGAADARSDIYGLGVVLWSLLAHRRDPHPFLRDRRATAPDEDATIEAPPAPSTFNSQVPLELDAVVLRALAYLPEDRFQSASDFRAALARFIPREGFTGETEVKQFLRRHVDPVPDRARLAEMTSGAAVLLDDDLHHHREVAAQDLALDHLGENPHVHRELLHGDLAPEPLTAVLGSRRPRLRIIAALVVLFAAGTAISMLTAAPHRQPSSMPISRATPSTTKPPIFDQTTPPTLVVPVPTPLTPSAAPPSAARLGAAASKPNPIGTRSPSALPRSVTRGQADPTSSLPHTADAEAQLRAAVERFEREDLQLALSLARRAARNGAGAPAYILIGRVLTIQGDIVGAESAFAEAVRLAPGDDRARTLLERARARLAQRRLGAPSP